MKFILEIDLDHRDEQTYGSLASAIQRPGTEILQDFEWSDKPEVGAHGVVHALHGVVGKWRIMASEKAYLCDFCREFETDSADELEDHWNVCPFNEANKDPRDIELDEYVAYVQAEAKAGITQIMLLDEWRYDRKVQREHEELIERSIALHEASLPADDE